ncbi:MAG: hypothetical protein R2880_03590 [Deinococcales bacterium]
MLTFLIVGAFPVDYHNTREQLLLLEDAFWLVAGTLLLAYAIAMFRLSFSKLRLGFLLMALAGWMIVLDKFLSLFQRLGLFSLPSWQEVNFIFEVLFTLGLSLGLLSLLFVFIQLSRQSIRRIAARAPHPSPPYSENYISTKPSQAR